MDEDFELYDGALSGPQIDALAQLDTTLPAIESSIAIVANGNTAPQNITAGQYVYVKNHSSLAEGLYYNKSGSTIASGTTLTSSNLGAVSNGVANELKSAINSLLTYYNSADKTTKTIASGAQETFGTLTVPIGRYIVFAEYLSNVDLPDKFTYINVLVSPAINMSSLGGYYAGPMIAARVGSIIWMGELGRAATFTLTAIAEQYTGQSFNLTLRNFCAVKIGDL